MKPSTHPLQQPKESAIRKLMQVKQEEYEFMMAEIEDTECGNIIKLRTEHEIETDCDDDGRAYAVLRLDCMNHDLFNGDTDQIFELLRLWTYTGFIDYFKVEYKN